MKIVAEGIEIVEEEIVKQKKSSRKKKNSFEDTFIIPTEKLLPNRLPIIPIQGHPFFPGIFTPLILSEKDDIITMIFDEIDTGVSGRAAQKIAEKLFLQVSAIPL